MELVEKRLGVSSDGKEVSFEIWKKWEVDKPWYWGGVSWSPRWVHFSMKPNTQLVFDF